MNPLDRHRPIIDLAEKATELILQAKDAESRLILEAAQTGVQLLDAIFARDRDRLYNVLRRQSAQVQRVITVVLLGAAAGAEMASHVRRSP